MSAKNNITKISKFIQSNPEIDGLVLTDPANLAYATGLNYQGLSGQKQFCVIAFFSEKKRFLACPKILANAYQNAGWNDSIITYSNCVDPEGSAVGVCAAFISELFEGVKGALGYVGDRMVQTLFEKLVARLHDFSFVDISDGFSRLRQIKSSVELHSLTRAAEYSDHGIAAALHHVSRSGTASEKSLTEAIRIHTLERGMPVNGYRAVAQALSEDDATVLWPHAPYYAVGRDGNFFEGKFIRLELCAMLDGYWANDARMMVKSDMNSSQKFFAAKMTELRKFACSQIKPGAVMKDVFASISIKGIEMGLHLASEFGYGHGIGVTPQEPPFISAADETILEKDMVLVLSLGARYTTGVSELYMTKDTLVVTEDGCRIVGWYENWDYPYTAAFTI
ncbi:MAG: M24 family metallopeptidase [Anaerolineaceae bacterium]|nr:M24 family metallopeptidase [Anaerolineaceae bacterium]